MSDGEADDSTGPLAHRADTSAESNDPWTRSAGPSQSDAAELYSGYPVTPTPDRESYDPLAAWETDDSSGDPGKVTVVLEDDLQGSWLGKYQVYRLTRSTTGQIIRRRYSDFAWLNDCLLARYPFRLLPSLPPKRLAVSGTQLATDQAFMDKRRRGLQRYSNAALAHPVLRRDGLLQTFFSTEVADLAAWRKSTPFTLQEESVERPLAAGTREESVPTDLDDRLAALKSVLPGLLAAWTRVMAALETLAAQQRAEMAEQTKAEEGLRATLDALRSDELAANVSQPLLQPVSTPILALADALGASAQVTTDHLHRQTEEALQNLKAHRELFTGFRLLLLRQDRLSPDNVATLKRQIAWATKRSQKAQEQRKPGYEAETQKYYDIIEKDQKTIDVLLKRRIYIRFCMWQEILYLFRRVALVGDSVKPMASLNHALYERLTAIYGQIENAF
ncbi:uncharacterized protein L969DRAFT_212896 [Mixia osmundae IAM 14324]|uniref:Sorting nexin MVP1 n=1 Tax=Mixia osmundae (strain CBS 9802 / IAM 14324 / JCM 22182 / KY 12970) TaxID=764103 RepID=G7DU13_MIXOS|nr:uncharacterized protein L969DRAFT_212896 [Mixia osmundae IAM 14324]KEI37085.1 hypothetical protein L969DRAFT_212896 [Mixia osmundae IAM 14324]GAA94073.1 hypothetical protein E5Q_00720 [Mixia osmundae IAM 14324]